MVKDEVKLPQKAPTPQLDKASDRSLGFNIAVKEAPPTQWRRPATTTDKAIEKPGTGRANHVVTREHPTGSREYSDREQRHTVLQQHTLFWDRDSDGIISPRDVYIGFRELGFNVFFSLLAVLIINGNFSYPTRLSVSYLPDPYFRIYVRGMHKAKHGSDSNTYDHEGRFVPQSFEDIFSKYDRDGDGALSLRETFDLMKAQRCVGDLYGWTATFLEWMTTWLLIQREGKIWKDDVKGIYDGSIFYRISEARKTKMGWRQGYGLGGDGFIGSRKIR